MSRGRIPLFARSIYAEVARLTAFLDLVYRIGQPIRYRYLSAPWRLGYHQNVYALRPGAAEMPSVGRAFTWRLLL